MRWLLFLSRVAFITGIFFILSVSLLIRDWTGDDAVTSTIITIGFTLGLVIVPIVNLSYLLVLVVKRQLKAIVPIWLIIANFLFLCILIAYILFINIY